MFSTGLVQMFLLKKFFQKHKKMIFDFDRSCPLLMLNDVSKLTTLYPPLLYLDVTLKLPINC